MIRYIILNSNKGIHASVALPVVTNSPDGDNCNLAVVVFYSTEVFEPKPELIAYLSNIVAKMNISTFVKTSAADFVGDREI